MVAEGRWSTVNYRLTHPEASVVTRRLESDEGTPAAIAQSIRMLDSSVDIYFTRTNFTGYKAMLEKGYCADLSSSQVLMDFVQGLYPAVQKEIMKDGKLYAIPVSISSSVLCYNVDKLEEVGLTQEDVPTNLVDLCASSPAGTMNGWTMKTRPTSCPFAPCPATGRLSLT